MGFGGDLCECGLHPQEINAYGGIVAGIGDEGYSRVWDWWSDE